jgi:hypothetical protein
MHVYVCMYVCVHVHMYVHVHVHVHVYVCTCTNECAGVTLLLNPGHVIMCKVYACMPACMYVPNICMVASGIMYIFTNTHSHVYIYIQLHIPTYTCDACTYTALTYKHTFGAYVAFEKHIHTHTYIYTYIHIVRYLSCVSGHCRALGHTPTLCVCCHQLARVPIIE